MTNWRPQGASGCSIRVTEQILVILPRGRSKTSAVDAAQRLFTQPGPGTEILRKSDRADLPPPVSMFAAGAALKRSTAECFVSHPCVRFAWIVPVDS